MIRLVDGNWGQVLADARKENSGEILVVSPFMKAGAVNVMLGQSRRPVRAITRFSLCDFASGASDVEALKILLNINAQVRGIKNLHSKLYVFGTGQAIVTSANLTNAALGGNHEFGFVTGNNEIVRTCQDYFERLWSQAGENCIVDQVIDWESQVTRHWLSAQGSGGESKLPDYGATAQSAELTDPKRILPKRYATKAFIKFFGTSYERRPLSHRVSVVVKAEGCHRVACYPTNRKPRSVSDGAVLYLGYLTQDDTARWPVNDIRVFGKAIAMKHDPNRDVATPEDLEQRPKKRKWANYIRLRHPEFIAGTLADAVSVNDLISSTSGLGSDAYATTKRNKELGTGNTNPKNAHPRQPAVKLSHEGHAWLDEKLDEAFASHGRIPASELRELSWPKVPQLPQLT